MSKVPITKAGAEMLRQELHRLKTVDRPSVITAIAVFRTVRLVSHCASRTTAQPVPSGSTAT